jgi:hypothetical protein
MGSAAVDVLTSFWLMLYRATAPLLVNQGTARKSMKARTLSCL